MNEQERQPETTTEELQARTAAAPSNAAAALDALSDDSVAIAEAAQAKGN
ncbi:MAG TPA: hypothetical protein VM938_10165 [Acidimicrobiales bacterium]|nr:hypothetical protein [Acidimicrobiales bacterium]